MKNNLERLKVKALVTLTLSFGVIFAAITIILWYFNLPLWTGVVTSVVIVLVQYLLSPIIIEILYSVKFYESVPQSLINNNIYNFIEHTCVENKIPMPMLGFITDGNPNAFVYGYRKKDARLILTTGIIDKLSDEELKGVIAHELGHIKNNDFIVMMAISIIPLIVYQIYIRSKEKNDSLSVIIGLGAYVVYLFSQYFVLAFSRFREYSADRFSRKIMGSGDVLASALIKIGYGYVSQDKKGKVSSSMLGISNSTQCQADFLVSYGFQGGEEEKEKLLSWDLKNPWGKWYELNSTHPLTGKRILALNNKTVATYKVNFKSIVTFIIESIIILLPWFLGGYLVVISRLNNLNVFGDFSTIVSGNKEILLLLGVSLIVYYYYSYKSTFHNSNIRDLLLNEEASPLRGIPATINVKAIGKGIPGLFFSEDMVVEDETGIILVDYRQPIKFLEFLFGLFKINNLIHSEIEVVGWYRRSVKPYFVCKYISHNGKKYYSYRYLMSKIFGYVFVLIGIILFFI